MKYKYKNEQTNPYLTHVVTEAGVCNILSALNKQHLCDTQDSHFHILETKDFLVHCEVFWLLTHLSHTDVDTRIDTLFEPCERGEALDRALLHKCQQCPLNPVAAEFGPVQ